MFRAKTHTRMDDYHLALQMQLDMDEADNDSATYVNEQPSQLGLVDKGWELIDPNPDARALFLEFNKTFFWNKLSGVEVRWSPQMTQLVLISDINCD